MKSKSSKSTIRALGQRSISSTLLFCSHPPNQTSSGDVKEGANSAALASFEQITEFAKGKKLALFLDYDGAISPIVDNPEYSFMSDDMRSAVKDVAKCFPTTIISGRSCDKVYEFIGLTELYYAGSHGMDIMSPAKHGISDGHPNCIKSTDKQDKEGILFQPASGFLPMIEEATKDIKGETVENNMFCLSVHYRNVDEKDWKTIWDLVIDILKGYPHSL